MRLICCFALLLCLPFFGTAQAPTILLAPHPQATDERAAAVLQQYLGQMTGQPVAVQKNLRVPAQGAVVFIGNHPNLGLAGLQTPPPLDGEAYFLQGKNNAFSIAGGGELGAEYGVYDLLERLGCRKFSPRDSLIPRVEQLTLPQLEAQVQTPAFPYRELHYEPAFDEGWARWHRLKTQADKSREWGLFVHTFQHLCPAGKYFDEHPGFFSWNGVQRSPGQICLSNDTVRQIVTDALREKIRERPEARYWSVSQNDNYDYCKCPRCAASDAYYGSPAGTLLAFVNAVAAEFPDKIISTLAYQYTREAPKGIRPAPNVSVCLCSIECNRGLPITEGCRDFARDLEDWSALTSRLMIWDYVVQFRSYLSPFPNWHTLQPNLQLFQRLGAQMVFEQGSGRDRSEFSDMRAYLLAKLMWNPGADMDSILTDFGQGYYGAAQPAVWAYVHALTESLQAHGDRLWIYDVPQNEDFLTDQLLDSQIAHLLEAENLLPAADSARLRHLQASILSAGYARAEKAKTDSLALRAMLADQPERYRAALDFFVQDCEQAGILHLNENGYSPQAYADDFVAFLEKLRRAAASKAYAPELTFPAAPIYANGNANELTNGRVGELDYRYNWLGFQGADLQATVQLRSDSCSQISVSFLQDQLSWVFFPRKVIFEISNNGQFFEHVYEQSIPIDPDGQKRIHTVEWNIPAPRGARYVRVTAFNLKTCPEWHSCTGNPCWIFADELVVR